MSDDDDFYRYTKDQLEAEHKNKIALGLLPPSKQKTPATDWQSRALAAEAERDALKAEVERLRAALKQARDWFMEVYSDLFEKRDLEGAARNYDRAHFCENHRNPKVKS